MEGSAFVLYNSNMITAAPAPAIRVYNLFGESGDLPDVVHCETIASRSVLHDWTLAVHRHARLHQVLLIERGGGEATLDGRVVPLKPMQIVNVPVGHVHGFRFVPDTQGWVLTIAAEILDEALLEQRHQERWTVADYAKALSITPTHLNRVTRTATGDTASHLILNRLIREARRNLVYTNLPVSTIAYALGFEDPAYFSRVYAAATGLSPRDFRAQLHGGE